MNIKDIIADSHLAFLSDENETALRLANEAIKLDPKNPNGYKCAGNACMSLERYDEAIKHYTEAVKYDPDNGNRYYDLGFAQTAGGKMLHVLENFTKAEELGCSKENILQLYNVLGVICFDIGRYDEALKHFGKVEQIIDGVDVDILKRKAIIYGIQNDIKNGLLVSNQIKLINISDYIGYGIAFKLMIQCNRLDAAEKELARAEKYAVLTMDFYFDNAALEVEKYIVDHNKEHLHSALAVIEKALKILKPTTGSVIESYIKSAEIYLQLEEPDKAIDCLNAAQSPVSAYNNGFEIAVKEPEMVTLTEYDIEDMIEADKERIAEKYGEYGLEELVESIEPDEDGNREYLTEIEDEPQEDIEVYKLDETEKIEYSSEVTDQINRIYIGAHTLRKDFEKVIEYARKLQVSGEAQNSYMGKYIEVNAMKELALPEVKKKYAEIIKFFRNALIKDPSDFLAATFRIQCYIDIGDYAMAEQKCILLPKEIKESLLEKIDEARSGKGGD